LEPTVIVDIVIAHLLKAASDPRTTDISVITGPKKCECAKSHYDVEHFHAKRDYQGMGGDTVSAQLVGLDPHQMSLCCGLTASL
jgi:hypothetical protein